MSHIAQVKTAIKAINKGLLQETLGLLAQANPDLRVENHVVDYYSKNIPVDCGLFTKKIHRGLGLNWSGKDTLEFIGDSFGAEAEYDQLKALLLQTYQVLAVKKSLTDMGYVAEVSQGTGGNVEVNGVHA